MAYNPERIVHCRKHEYRGHTYWTVGCAPEGEPMTGLLAARAEVGKGTVSRQITDQAYQAFAAELWATKGWALADDVPFANIEERFRATRAAFRASPGLGQPSPREAALERWHARLDWYLCGDDDGEPGAPLRPAAFRFPASCLAEGIVIGRIFPDGLPNILPGQGKDQQLTPYKGTDPAKVAEWAGCRHFGLPTVQRVRMQRTIDGVKTELPNTDPLPAEVTDGQ